MPQLSFPTPVGEVTLTEENGAIVALTWGNGDEGRETPLLRWARIQLQEYFACRLTAFDLPLAPHGTPFQTRVWQALRTIPYGETCAYATLGLLLGCPSARAIGQANARNPIPIIIPCHRVVASDGSLGGYSGKGGVATKRFLLSLEQRARPHYLTQTPRRLPLVHRRS